MTRFRTTADERDAPARSSVRRVRAARSAGQMPSARTTTTVASAPSRSTNESNATPVESSASRASPRGAMGDNNVAITTAPAAPARPTTRFRAMSSAKSSRPDMPTATSVGWSSLSTALWRASAWPTTASPTSAASAARIHHPTACGWMDPWIVAAVPSSVEAPTSPLPRFSDLSWLSNWGMPAAPWRRRTKYW